MTNTNTASPPTTTARQQHPSERGVHYLYLQDGKNRMVGCIATVRRGQKLFIGSSFCSGRNGDVFRKAQGRSIAEGRALRRADEQDRIMEVLSSKSIDQTSDSVQFLLRAQHALCVDLDVLGADGTHPNAFDVLKAILTNVIEFDSELDDRCHFDFGDSQGQESETLDGVLTYFARLDLPGGLVRAARRKLNDVSLESNARESFGLAEAIRELTGGLPRSFLPDLSGAFNAEDVRGVDWSKPGNAVPLAGVLGPVIPSTDR
jgi:hypothetical protein